MYMRVLHVHVCTCMYSSRATVWYDDVCTSYIVRVCVHSTCMYSYIVALLYKVALRVESTLKVFYKKVLERATVDPLALALLYAMYVCT